MADVAGPAADPATWSCPLPLRDHDTVVLGHGGGGRLSAELVEHLFLPAFGGADPAGLHDAAVVEAGGARLAFSTDSYVVRPLFFPGGNIGHLAVHGTINDVAMAGATPLFLSTAFIVEEGLPLEVLGRVAEAMGEAARLAGVRLVTGDTKVVDQGHGDGLFVTTAGVGLVPPGVHIGPDRARPGDAVIVSGSIGRHGIAVLSVREGLEFGTVVESDTAPLHGLVAAMLAAAPGVHVLRDPTRGGLAATLNEIAASSAVGVEIAERAVPVPPEVRAACGFLGLDPYAVANEGVLVAFVDPASVDAVVGAMQDHPQGRGAAVIGRVTDAHPGVVAAVTAIGGTRIVDLPLGEQLPRIC
ncbi:MAG: hydrogenase expression/formation protein HypE [Acidimicrobiales bacterium]|nr:hydrogenase expression/formation protein HypE [Acidimicrobiales bacterium]